LRRNKEKNKTRKEQEKRSPTKLLGLELAHQLLGEVFLGLALFE